MLVGTGFVPANGSKVFADESARSQNTEAAPVSRTDFHVSDSEWEKQEEKLLKDDPSLTADDLKAMRGQYEYDQYEKLYGEQIRNVDGIKYLYNEGEPEKDAWFATDAAWVRSDENGKLYTAEWQFINGSWYHFDQMGNMQTGWFWDGTDWYYLDPRSGAMANEGWNQIDKIWYYMAPSGAMKTGWICTGDRWYYLDDSGFMEYGGWLYVGDTWYWLNYDGSMKTGWLHTDTGWYYLNFDGAMQTGWNEIDGKWYYLDSDGRMAENTVIRQNGKSYRVDVSGAWIN